MYPTLSASWHIVRLSLPILSAHSISFTHWNLWFEPNFSVIMSLKSCQPSSSALIFSSFSFITMNEVCLFLPFTHSEDLLYFCLQDFAPIIIPSIFCSQFLPLSSYLILVMNKCAFMSLILKQNKMYFDLIHFSSWSHCSAFPNNKTF